MSLLLSLGYIFVVMDQSVHRCTHNVMPVIVSYSEDIDWVKKCMEYEVDGSRPRGRPKRTWKEVVQKDCRAVI